MIVYHGTTQIIKYPNIKFSKKYLDFGKGFYVTTFKEQAEKWALRKGMRQKQDSIVNIYDMDDDLKEYKVLKFNNENEKWLEFVCACRRGELEYKDYDIIIGNVANDDVFKTIDLYFRGIWNKERVINELRYYKMNNQICIVNQNILDSIITYKKSYKLGEYNEK